MQLFETSNWKPSYKYVVIGLLEFIVLMGIFVIILYYDFDDVFGFRNDCLNKDHTKDECYCEKFSDTVVKEPVNTYSALSFIVIGFGILITLTQEVSPTNLMRSSAWFPATYGFIVIFMAQGSMCFHGSMTGTGGFVDTVSMFMWVSYTITFAILRLTPLRTVIGILVWCFLVISATIIQELIRGSTVFTVLVVLTILLECVVFYRVWKIVSPAKCFKSCAPLGAALVIFAIAFTIWNLSHTGDVLCWPKSAFQGHGVWHALSAVATGLVYLYIFFGVDPPKIQIPNRCCIPGLFTSDDNELASVVP